MTQPTPGRHRRPGRLSAASTSLTRSAAIAAASSGLLAGTAVSASAQPAAEDTPVKAAEALVRLGETVQTDRALLVDRPAKAAPAPEVSPTNFGTSGFTAFTPVVEEAQETVEEAAPAAATQTEGAAQAAVETRSQTTASRSETRSEPVQQAATQPAQQQAATQPVQQQAAPAAPAPAAPSYGGAVGIASGLMGIPYAYGSSNPAVGFDCSGFTKYVYAQLGISLPHSAAAQQASVTPVSNPQPGDLVFFGYPAWHVGIYAGNGMIYQATNPGNVSNYMAISSIYGSVSGYGRP